MGVGLIARDQTEIAKVCMCTTQSYISDSATAEAYAARRGLDFCRELGLRSIILEGDLREIVMALRKEEGWLRKYSNFLIDAHNTLLTFHDWSTSFVG
jgi:hypothetical protein